MKNKGADQLHSYHEADMGLCFRICKTLVFSWSSSYFFMVGLCILLYCGPFNDFQGCKNPYVYGIYMYFAQVMLIFVLNCGMWIWNKNYCGKMKLTKHASTLPFEPQREKLVYVVFDQVQHKPEKPPWPSSLCYLLCKPGVLSSIPGFSRLLDETLNRGPVSVWP